MSNEKPVPGSNDVLHDTPDALEWLAFRYVVGELDQDKKTAFEKRLADDQSAREAVATAIKLGDSVVAAFALSEETREPMPVLAAPLTASGDAWNWKPIFVLAGALALLIAGTWFVSQPPNDDRQLSAESDSIAVAWVAAISADDDIVEAVFTDVDFETDWNDAQDTDWMLVALADLSDFEDANEMNSGTDGNGNGKLDDE